MGKYEIEDYGTLRTILIELGFRKIEETTRGDGLIHAVWISSGGILLFRGHDDSIVMEMNGSEFGICCKNSQEK